MYDLDTTHEERPIKSITISLDGVVGNNPIVFIDNGIQGSDWINLMTVAYLIYQLVENSANNMDLLMADWVIIPIVNPDGLVYSQTVDRFWSKNRVPIDKNCVGVDLNSNFDSVWKPSKNVRRSQYRFLL
jgi:murein tripeptide amidase MpaA